MFDRKKTPYKHVKDFNNVQGFYKSKRLELFVGLLIVFLFITLACIALYFLFEKQLISFLVRFLPSDDGKTSNYYIDLFRVAMAELIWLSITISIALVFYMRPAMIRYVENIERWSVMNHRKVAYAVIIITGVIVFVVAFFVLDQFPNSSDEYVYVYQAETLREGKLFNSAPPVEKAFGFNHIAVKDGISAGRFPPGWPLVLSFFLMTGLPGAISNVVLGLITLLFLYKFLLKVYSPETALWSLVFTAASAFFIFNSASFFSHTISLMALIISLYALVMNYEKFRIEWLLLSGFLLGFIFITRYYTALLLFIPIGIWIVGKEKANFWKPFLWLAAGGIPCVIVLLIYNYLITGHPLMPVTVWAYADEGLGFVNGHTFGKAIEHIIRRFFMYMYWVSPILLFLYFFYLFNKSTQAKGLFSYRPEAYFFIILVIGYMLYYEIGGNQYGPRFYFEAFPLMVVFTVHQVLQRNQYSVKVLLYATLIVMLIKLPLIAHREHKVIQERMDVFKSVKRNNIHHAIVILKSGTGVIRPMPSGDLTRNDPAFTNDVLYAIDNPDSNQKLMEHFSDRSVYVYTREPSKVNGKLLRIK